MAFNGTRHFPKQDVIAFLQSIGMRFGAHINANTSFDQTVYQLQIPTDDAGVIDRSFLDPRGLGARGVSFDPDEIDKERGVILEEWRARPRRRRAHAATSSCRSCSRARATPSACRSARPRSSAPSRHERLKKFYTRLVPARPDGGDRRRRLRSGRDRGADQGALRRDPGRRRRRKPRPIYDVPDQPGTRYTIATDPEATGDRRSASRARWPRAIRRRSAPIASRRSSASFAACSRRASARWRRSRTRRSSPRGTNRGLFVHSAEATTLSALVPDGGVEKGLAALFTEADRVARFGFTQTELDRYRLATVRSLRAARRVERRAHVGVARRRVHPQLHAAGADSRHRLRVRAGPALPAGDHARRRQRPRRDWVPDRNRVVAVSAPQKAGVPMPDEAKLAAVIKRRQRRRR